MHPGAAIERDFLPALDAAACTRFRRDYPGLGGVVTVSRIGFSVDSRRALLSWRHDCGPAVQQAAYVLLEQIEDDWQVVNTISAATSLPDLSPVLTYNGGIGGCGDIFVYAGNNGRTEYLTIFLDARALALTTESRTLSLSDWPDAVRVAVAVYADDIHTLGQFPYCNDVAPVAVAQSIWEAISGTVTVQASAVPPAESCAGESYQVTVHLADVTFMLNNDSVYLPALALPDVTVGWCAG